MRTDTSSPKVISKWVTILALALMTSSCHNLQDDSSELKLTLTPKKPLAIPTGGQSCQDQFEGTFPGSLEAAHIIFNRFNISWEGEKTVDIAYAKGKLTGSNLVNGEYNFEITFDDLETSFGGEGTGVSLSPERKTVESLCGLRLGGIKFLDEKAPAFLNGIIRLYGVINTEESSEYVTTDFYFQIQYDGDNF